MGDKCHWSDVRFRIDGSMMRGIAGTSAPASINRFVDVVPPKLKSTVNRPRERSARMRVVFELPLPVLAMTLMPNCLLNSLSVSRMCRESLPPRLNTICPSA